MKITKNQRQPGPKRGVKLPTAILNVEKQLQLTTVQLLVIFIGWRLGQG